MKPEDMIEKVRTLERDLNNLNLELSKLVNYVQSGSWDVSPIKEITEISSLSQESVSDLAS